MRLAIYRSFAAVLLSISPAYAEAQPQSLFMQYPILKYVAVPVAVLVVDLFSGGHLLEGLNTLLSLFFGKRKTQAQAKKESDDIYKKKLSTKEIIIYILFVVSVLAVVTYYQLR